MIKSEYDFLSEYHLYNPELKLYSILEEVAELIAQSRTREVKNNGAKKKELVDKLQSLLTDAAGKRLFELLCRRQNVNAEMIYNSNPAYKNPTLLLRVLFLQSMLDSFALVSQELDLESDDVKDILELLKIAFQFADPLSWLQNFLNKDVRYKKMLQTSVILGREEVGQSIDTAEERKLRERRKYDNSNSSSEKI